MSKRDYQKEYWDKVHAWNDKKRAERKAQENNSNFTILSLVGFALGVGLFYHTAHVVLGTIASVSYTHLRNGCHCRSKERGGVGTH